MGLLTDGSALSWEETKHYADYVRKHGIIQFINIFNKYKDRQGDPFKWGDEVEFLIVKFNDKDKTAKLCLKGDELLKVLNEKEENDPTGVESLWRPEYASFMIEGTPGKPYDGFFDGLNKIEINMNNRRQEIMKLLEPGEVVMTLTNFPRLGCPNFTEPPTYPTPNVGITKSLFLSDETIANNTRYQTVARNFVDRRGEKVISNIPIYRDVNVARPFKENLSIYGDDGTSEKLTKENHIYMDSIGFGFSCCCLQQTMQAYDLKEAKFIYDQLAPMCGIMLSLTAASPFYRGYMSNVDTRWNILNDIADCRTKEERGITPLKENKFLINKTRYNSISSYLSEQADKYNDIPLTYDDNIFNQLLKNGIDCLLAKHIAYLFIRDPLFLFSEKLNLNDEIATDHFENIQSTNWQTMRFKPPPGNSSSSIGWRVEFRPCELQITDFENAAISCFIILLSRVILAYNLNLLIPISKLDDNMTRAAKRDSIRVEKFWFRKNIMREEEGNDIVDEYAEFTVNEIINGKEGVFIGLMPLIYSYLGNIDIDTETYCKLKKYLEFIQRKASGEIITTASWLRKFVMTHPDYKNDSVISDRINYDLLKKIHDIQTNVDPCPELLGTWRMSKKKL
ncbi:hypothetical protein HCN44_000997 [Aphidius gifuensis]|uniref:Glutamate--cysteine ligase n=1 Tax=Aphidius gifuensis TaxID=684658 RepID=A0A835CL62_APHGI|nr:glutamate--cysteine ligase-like [Aphidius gifuensis]KAF7988424.1 hypothetical protein HCN44_000997 [Aphidius gifuensis]